MNLRCILILVYPEFLDPSRIYDSRVVYIINVMSEFLKNHYILESKTDAKNDTVTHEITFVRDDQDDTKAVEIVDSTAFEQKFKNITKKKFFIWK